MTHPILRLATGGAVWNIPGDSRLQLLWNGPGGGLFLADAFTPGGLMVRIEHPSADGTYDSAAAAQRAVDAYLAASPQSA